MRIRLSELKRIVAEEIRSRGVHATSGRLIAESVTLLDRLQSLCRLYDDARKGDIRRSHRYKAPSVSITGVYDQIQSVISQLRSSGLTDDEIIEGEPSAERFVRTRV